MNYGIIFSCFFVVIVLILAFFFMFFCEKVFFVLVFVFEFVEFNNLVEVEYMFREKIYMQDFVFVFDIQESYCIQDGVYLNVFIDRLENYSFMWAIDGSYVGYNSYIFGCVCGNMVIVFIICLLDGLFLCKIIDFL